MKKIVFTLIAASLLGSTAFAVELDNPKVTDNKITVSGTADNANATVSVLVLKPGTSFDGLTQSTADSNTVYAKQVTADSGGKFTVEFGLPETCAENAIYPTAVFSNGEKKETHFYYIRQNGLAVILNKFNNHEDTVKNLLTYYSTTEPALNITLDGFYDENQTAVDTVFEKNRTNLSTGKFAALSEIESAYTTAAATVKLNKLTDKAELIKELAASKDVFGFYSEENMTYDTDNLAELFIKYRGNGFDSSAAVTSAYKQAYITAVINKTTDSEVIDKFIVKNAGDIGVNAKEYEKYKSPTVGSIIAGKSGFGGYDDIKKAVTSAIAELDKKDEQGGGTSGGSTSSSGSGGKKTADIYIPQPQITQNESKNEIFSDLKDVQWAKTAIEALNKLGIVSGKGNGEFKPKDIILREEFTAMAVRLLELPLDGKNSSFADVGENDWYAPYVSAAYDAGLIYGKDSTHFGAGDTVSRQDMAAILYRCAEKKNIELPEEREAKEFSDYEDISDYAVNAVNKLYRARIISGFDDGSFMPNAQSTRAQAAQMIYGLAKTIGKLGK